MTLEEWMLHLRDNHKETQITNGDCHYALNPSSVYLHSCRYNNRTTYQDHNQLTLVQSVAKTLIQVGWYYPENDCLDLLLKIISLCSGRWWVP